MLLLSLLVACDSGPAVPGLFVLGVDGMDPVITQRLMGEGRLPNLARLAAAGGFQPLGTVNPPQSPVAWSSFVTGLDPGGHGIFDFVHRDPAHYTPISSATPPVGDAGTAVEIGGLYFPVGGDPVVNNRGGVPFWDLLHAAGVDVEVYRIPGNYPPTPSEARVLSGMGTVDMRGGYGVYTWFTETPVHKDGTIKGDIQLVTVDDTDLDGTPDSVHGTIKGPPDLFRLPPGKSPGEADYLTAGVQFWLDGDAVLIEAGDDTALLKQGEWSPWMKLTFDALPYGAMPFSGIVRFYAKELSPHVKIYASPVNIAPDDPAQPISTPDDWSKDLADLIGPFATQGMPEETNALNDGTFDDDDYLGQVALVHAETRSMAAAAVTRFEPGDMTFVYLSEIDLQCHMLWRHADPKHLGAPHPARDEATAAKHAGDIQHFYEGADSLVGRLLEQLPAGTPFLLMSDHGFQPYTREVHLNTWLRDNGWLTLKDGKTVGQIAAGDVDWSRTRAYNLGFNAVYLNERGREAEGIVDPATSDAVMADLMAQLVAMQDPQGGARPVRRVARAKDIYSAARRAEAPDLIVGYDVGYGTSDQSTLGEIVPEWISDNTSRWSGNHLMDPEVVPGVLFANRPIPPGQPDLLDVTATVLAAFHLPPAAGMNGTPIFPPQD